MTDDVRKILGIPDGESSAFLNADCMKYLPLFSDNCFDLAIVDPPYGINANSFGMGDHLRGRGDSTARKVERKRRLNQGAGKLKDRALQNMNCDWDFKIPPPEYFSELRRVSKNQIIWGGNYFDLPPTRGVICWDKEQPWENFSQWEMAWTSFDMPAALFRKNNSFAEPGKIHPTQKPVALYKWLIGKYAAAWDLILDTHAGSGSCLVACRETGHSYVGFEIDKTYYDAAAERLQAAIDQVNIYDLFEQMEIKV